MNKLPYLLTCLFTLDLYIMTTSSANAQNPPFTQFVKDTVVKQETVSSGVQDITQSGVAQNTTIANEGVQRVHDGGQTSQSMIFGGGIQKVEQGGMAIGTRVKAGGLQTIGSGGVSIGAIIGADTAEHIQSQAILKEPN
jgi:autotransporter passenger strand-loop-strand repeat protein